VSKSKAVIRLLLATIATAWLAAIASPAVAQIHTNPLIERGINPRVLDIAAIPMTQDLAFVYEFVVRIEEGTDVREGLVHAIYDPYDEFGLDVTFHIPPGGDAAGLTDSDLRRLLEDEHRLSRQAAGANLFDASTIHVSGSEAGAEIISFAYRDRLPSAYRFLEKMVGHAYVSSDGLERVRIDSVEPFKQGGTKIDAYTQTTWFLRPPGGGYLIDRYTIRARKQGGRVVHLEARALEYRDADGHRLDFRGEGLGEPLVFDGRLVRVKLDYPLPLLGRQATKLGYDLPRPFGVDLFIHAQDEILKFESIKVDGEDLGDLVNLEDTTLSSTTWVQAAKADVWVLPFVNVMGIVGRATSKTTLGLQLSGPFSEALDFFEPGSGASLELSDDLDSLLYGGGVTLAGGVGNAFATINLQYLTSTVPDAGTSVQAFVFMPLVGYRFPFINVIGGAQYQDYDKKVTGSIPIEGESPLEFEVLLKSVQWNLILGLQKDLSKSWNFSVMGGFGERTSATFTIGYRFGGPSFER